MGFLSNIASSFKTGISKVAQIVQPLVSNVVVPSLKQIPIVGNVAAAGLNGALSLAAGYNSNASTSLVPYVPTGVQKGSMLGKGKTSIISGLMDGSRALKPEPVPVSTNPIKQSLVYGDVVTKTASGDDKDKPVDTNVIVIAVLFFFGLIYLLFSRKSRRK